MIRAELKAGEHLPTERWRKDVVRALDLLEAELRGCDDYPGFFKRANGGGNSLNGHSVVLYDRLGDKLNFFGEDQTASPLVASGRYLLITTWVCDFVDPRHLVATPLEGLHKGGYKTSRTEESTGMVKLREDWLKLLYGQGRRLHHLRDDGLRRHSTRGGAIPRPQNHAPLSRQGRWKRQTQALPICRGREHVARLLRHADEDPA